MANLYIQTIADARQAVRELEAMGLKTSTYIGSGITVEGFGLATLTSRDHEWPDGDWISERAEAVLDLQGTLWKFTRSTSYAEGGPPTFAREHRDEKTLIEMTPALLRETDGQGGDFRAIREALKKLL